MALPKKNHYTILQKIKVIKSMQKGMNPSEAARHHNISYILAYKWKKRYSLDHLMLLKERKDSQEKIKSIKEKLKNSNESA